MKIPAGLFAEIDKLSLKFIWNAKNKTILKKKNKIGGLTIISLLIKNYSHQDYVVLAPR